MKHLPLLIRRMLMRLHSVKTMFRIRAVWHLISRFRKEQSVLPWQLQVDEEFARGYYFYLDPKRQRLEYKSAIRMHEQGGWTFQYDVELERPLELIPGKRIPWKFISMSL